MNTHQVVFLLLDLCVIVLLGAVARTVGQPSVIGKILAGILLGPTLLGDAFSGTLFPADVRPFLAALANVGVALFMFLVGLEMDARLPRGQGRNAATVSVFSLVVPFGLGVALASYLVTTMPTENRLGFVLFLGVRPLLRRIFDAGTGLRGGQLAVVLSLIQPARRLATGPDRAVEPELASRTGSGRS